jgi:hypothetical protein
MIVSKFRRLKNLLDQTLRFPSRLVKSVNENNSLRMLSSQINTDSGIFWDFTANLLVFIQIIILDILKPMTDFLRCMFLLRGGKNKPVSVLSTVFIVK